jgi:3-oxoacyl-[acyl-carrier-protein] synthase-3
VSHFPKHPLFLKEISSERRKEDVSRGTSRRNVQVKEKLLKHSIGILGTGSYIPEQILTNQSLEESLGLAEGWIYGKTGIKERRVAQKQEATSDLATKAAQQALAAAHIQASEIDLLVVATSTPDYPQPSTACIVQANIGAKNAIAFDLSAVCTGFVYALAIVEAAMSAHENWHTALIIGADTYSRILDYTDHRTSILFGDGAGAVVIGKVEEGYGILSCHLQSDGNRSSLIQVPGGGSRKPVSTLSIESKDHFFHMDGRAVRTFVQDIFPATVSASLHSAHLELDDIDLMIPHQANGVILRECAQALSFPQERMHMTIEKYGNTSAASIPITLDDAIQQERIQERQAILLVGFGGGLTWGSIVMRWPQKAVRSVSKAKEILVCK